MTVAIACSGNLFVMISRHSASVPLAISEIEYPSENNNISFSIFFPPALKGWNFKIVTLFMLQF